MAIRFDGTNGEWAQATTADFYLPVYDPFCVTAIVKVSALTVKQQTFLALERMPLGLWIGYHSGFLRVYSYSGAMICQVGAMVVGGTYGIALLNGPGGGYPNPTAVKAVMQRLDVPGALAEAFGPLPNASYGSNRITQLKVGNSSYNEPLNGTVENLQVYGGTSTNVQIQGHWAARSPVFFGTTPLRWFAMNGPTLTQAVVDTKAQGNLVLTGSLAYEAGWTDSATVYSETLNETVTLTDSWAEEHIDISSTLDPMSETVTLGDSYATTLIAGSSFSETITLTDSWKVSLRTPSPLLEAHYSGPGTPSLSIGGAKSTVQVRQGLFGRLTQEQWAAGGSYYRCIYLTASGDRDEFGVYVLSQTTSSFTDVAIGWGAPINTLEPAIATERLGPPSVSFYPAATRAEAILGGDFLADQWRALWIRYRITGTNIILDDDFQLRIVSL